jgi:hypothetical protein
MSQVWYVISEYCDQTSLINFVLIHRPIVLSWLLVFIKRLYNILILMVGASIICLYCDTSCSYLVSLYEAKMCTNI